MSSDIYLPRTLLHENKMYSECEIISLSKHIVVLAEPGGGKTELLDNLALQLSSTATTASVFGFNDSLSKREPLIIDAFDELAKFDSNAINKILGKAKAANPSHLIISSRSSEWDNASSHVFQDFFGQKPTVVRLLEFNQSEQRKIFEYHAPKESFTSFQNEVSRFNLEILLPNPQFLKLFTDAYIESDRVFSNKQSIFRKAVDRLARETNEGVKKPKTLISLKSKTQFASEVFTILYLSGSEGISTSENSETRMYPNITTLLEEKCPPQSILSTRLFKPGIISDHHRPVHKVIAEYCIAEFIATRIKDSNNHLSISKCLSIIAPNAAARDDLRGILGWLASQGDLPTQEAIINLDPYAVLANGDPSKLHAPSKQQLINQLSKLESIDPYFRKGDYSRSFSLVGFFTNEVTEQIKPLLLVESGGHLRGLLLEMIAKSPAINDLTDVLLKLALSPYQNSHLRLLAAKRLLENDRCILTPYLPILLFESSITSLKIATKIFKNHNSAKIHNFHLISLFFCCANLYPNSSRTFDDSFGDRYFVKRFFSSLDLKTTEWLLNETKNEFNCTCRKHPYECTCRIGKSKIFSQLLDRYFEFSTPPYNPKQIWEWACNLNFRIGNSADKNKATRVLQDDKFLREGILTHVFQDLTRKAEFDAILKNSFSHHSHAGLLLDSTDRTFILNLAFNTDNTFLWEQFYVSHNYYANNNESGTDIFRNKMRLQAKQKSTFMTAWARLNKSEKRTIKEYRRLFPKSKHRQQKEQLEKEKASKAYISYIQANRVSIQRGSDWPTLFHFARLYLYKPELIKDNIGDEKLVKTTLKNCLQYIETKTPTIAHIAEFHCEGKRHKSITVLFAACLEILRSDGNLNIVNLELLRALRTKDSMYYDGISETEITNIQNEIDRRIFANENDKKTFLQEYIEPQLKKLNCTNEHISILEFEVFDELKPTLTVDWLSRFNNASVSSLSSLFEFAARYSDPDKLKILISDRCYEIMHRPLPSNDKEIEAKRTFWLIREWFFIDIATNKYWKYLRNDKEVIFALDNISGDFHRNQYPSWPQLSAVKVEAILNSYVDRWPRVPLPRSHGTDSPKTEIAYRYLSEIVWAITKDTYKESLPVLNRLLNDPRYIDFHTDLKSIKATQQRANALSDDLLITPENIQRLLEHDEVVSVAGLRKLMIEELTHYQNDINGGEFDSRDLYFDKAKIEGKNKYSYTHKNENACTLIIADRLRHRLHSKEIIITPEHQLANTKRSDFTATKFINKSRKLLVAEVKGQWHKDLFSAATTQLHERYSNHPEAERQGIYLVLWFGQTIEVAKKRKHSFSTADELKREIENRMPIDIACRTDVFILDLAKR